MQTPAVAAVGDKIEHDLMPGFTMIVHAVEPCETDGTRSEPHSRYKIIDPDEVDDWLCAYDVRKVG